MAKRISASAVTFGLIFSALAVVQVKVQPSMLLAERFVPGLGWLEIAFLAVYGAVLCRVMLDPAQARRWRGRIWLLFSIVFFGQLILGLSGLDIFLMTGELHLPVPALILAGPVYRGEGFFMPVLFLSTVFLVGPAWCSHLCYIGAWDHLAAGRNRGQEDLPKWAPYLRAAILVMTLVLALGLRMAGTSWSIGFALAAGFGLAGVGLMMFESRRRKQMVHCAVFCPMGLVSDLVGKLNPFRIRISSGCTKCGVCSSACRYGALRKEDIEKRKPGLSCSLCGDCISSCRHKQLSYTFPGLSDRAARVLFLILTVSTHSVFLGLARI